MYELEGVVKVRAVAASECHIQIDRMVVRRGEAVGILGPSGSGKSTLLDMIGLILKPDEAMTFRFRTDTGKTADVGDLWRSHKHDKLASLRASHIGYVLQLGGLLPFLTVRKNIELPLRLLGQVERDRVESLARALDIVRLLPQYPSRLSVGERQRAAIARALAHGPAVVLADEPTASLDPVNGERVLAELLACAEAFGATLLVTTHDADVVRRLRLRPLVHELTVGPSNRIISTFRD